MDLTNLPGTTGTDNATPPPAQEEAPILYQSYASSRSSMRMITDTGVRIIFVAFQFLTVDESVIAYLDSQIKVGGTGVTKGEKMPLVDPDPMKTLKEKHFAEFEAQQRTQVAAIANGDLRDMGNTKLPGAPKINPASTTAVASGASNSAQAPK